MAIIRESVRTSKRSEMIEVTDRVGAVVRKAGVREGMVIVCVPSTTGGGSCRS
jgi:thiamine phosphate synthase YjbQ (UPF0047 family)